jgi:hypothetical protein
MPASWFERLSLIATRRILAVLMVIFLVLFVVVFPAVSMRLKDLSGGEQMIDLQPGYTPARVFAMVAAFGPEGRSLHMGATLTADLLYPLDYSFLFALVIISTYRQAFPSGRLLPTLALVPFITAGFDLLENAGIVTLLASYPTQPVWIAQAASLFTILKWTFVLLSLLLILIGFIALAVTRLRK